MSWRHIRASRGRRTGQYELANEVRIRVLAAGTGPGSGTVASSGSPLLAAISQPTAFECVYARLSQACLVGLRELAAGAQNRLPVLVSGTTIFARIIRIAPLFHQFASSAFGAVAGQSA